MSALCFSPSPSFSGTRPGPRCCRGRSGNCNPLTGQWCHRQGGSTVRSSSRARLLGAPWRTLLLPLLLAWTGTGFRNPAGPQGASSLKVTTLASTVRWNLDDVERISRGRPSKAKMGSRAVPHRLNAEERKAYELAKKRGYVVQQANTRRYPLINTYRNYCDALGFPCIRIEQGPAGSTYEVVVDLTPLHLQENELFTLRDEISKAVASMPAVHDEIQTSSGVSMVNEEGMQLENHDDSSLLKENQLSEADLQESIISTGEDIDTKPLRFLHPRRNMAKSIVQTILDTWRGLSTTKARKLVA